MFNKFFFIENHVDYEIMFKGIVKADKPHLTVLRMRVKTKNTHSCYMILMAFPLQHWLHERP